MTSAVAEIGTSVRGPTAAAGLVAVMAAQTSSESIGGTSGCGAGSVAPARFCATVSPKPRSVFLWQPKVWQASKATVTHAERTEPVADMHRSVGGGSSDSSRNQSSRDERRHSRAAFKISVLPSAPRVCIHIKPTVAPVPEERRNWQVGHAQLLPPAKVSPPLSAENITSVFAHAAAPPWAL